MKGTIKSKKLILTMLALLIMDASFFNSYQSTQAQENDSDAVQESITELGIYEQVFAQNKKSKMSPAVGEIYAYVKLSGV